MRKQIAAANWKMNLNLPQATSLVADICSTPIDLEENQRVIFAVPFPYLVSINQMIETRDKFLTAAQNCSDKKSGAYTGEVSAEMLHSINVGYCIVGHSERREYFGETNFVLREKINQCLDHDICPIFCCGEALPVRERGGQNELVELQLNESLFHLKADQLTKIIIAYEPVWAIGTGKTATATQAQEMHAYIRWLLKNQYGESAAELVPILYGGSVKAGNAKELFDCDDVDGGLVGGASLVPADFIKIIRSLKF